METQASFGVFNIHQPPHSLHNLQRSFSIINMVQFDDDPGLQGALHESIMCLPGTPSSLRFSSPGLPVDNMYQENWGMNEIPTPFLEPITESAGVSSGSTQYMADFSYIRQLHSIQTCGICSQRHAKPQTFHPIWRRWALKVHSRHRKARMPPLIPSSISTRLVI